MERAGRLPEIHEGDIFIQEGRKIVFDIALGVPCSREMSWRL